MVYELRAYAAMPLRLPDLNRRFAETEKNGPLLGWLTAQILTPTTHSPMK